MREDYFGAKKTASNLQHTPWSAHLKLQLKFGAFFRDAGSPRTRPKQAIIHAIRPRCPTPLHFLSPSACGHFLFPTSSFLVPLSIIYLPLYSSSQRSSFIAVN
jgi:hypothetical protein